MRLPAEMLRACLPPRTVGTTRAVSTAVLESAYEIGGDAFDHALTDPALHASIFDAPEARTPTIRARRAVP
ncbi:hypothetical protein [Streptomyces sp. NPDC056723]|uniref:hypothetical protein n=1 Tax=Streptomyces sp. NPDC056723 TaxID=3345925 RepID=UPI0036C0EDDF